MKKKKSTFKKIADILFYIVAVGAIVYLAKQKFIVPAIDTNALELIDYDNNPVHLEKYHGKVLVLNFWQTWCAPCIREMPSLNEMSEKWDGVRVVAVTDEPYHKVKSIRDSNPNIEFLHIKNFNETDISQFPTTYVFNKKGVKVSSKIGAKNWSDDSYISSLKSNYGN